MDPFDKVSLMTIATAIELVKTCKSKRQAIRELEKWLAEREATIKV